MNEIKKCVTCILRNDEGQILVLEHMKCKNKFTFPAGTLEPNEEDMGLAHGALTAAVREMKEELDLTLLPKHFTKVSNRFAYYDRIDGHRVYKETVLEYNERINEADVKNMEPEKHPTMRWVSEAFIFTNPELFTYNTWLTIADFINKSI